VRLTNAQDPVRRAAFTLMRFQAVSNEFDEGENKQELDEAIERARAGDS
jgi:hypothetical protein